MREAAHRARAVPAVLRDAPRAGTLRQLPGRRGKDRDVPVPPPWGYGAGTGLSWGSQLGLGLAASRQQGWVPAGPAPDGVCSVQAGYEVAPDEKRKECGQHLIEKYLKPKVSERSGLVPAGVDGTAARLAAPRHPGRRERAKSTPRAPALLFPLLPKHLGAVSVGFSFPSGTPGLCSLGLTRSLRPQSEDHVPEVPPQLVDACCERLEQEPSKELFKESTKYVVGPGSHRRPPRPPRSLPPDPRGLVLGLGLRGQSSGPVVCSTAPGKQTQGAPVGSESHKLLREPLAALGSLWG